jgi:hypothetical protein
MTRFVTLVLDIKLHHSSFHEEGASKLQSEILHLNLVIDACFCP